MSHSYSRVSKPKVSGTAVSFLYEWAFGIAGMEVQSLQIILAPLPDRGSDWLLQIAGPARQAYVGVGMQIDEILKGNSVISNILWYSSEDWNRWRKDGTPLPF